MLISVQIFKTILVLVLTGMSLWVQAQYANKIWYFGEYAGINFNISPPSSLSNSMLQSYDNNSTITDTNGNLLFYTNGVTVWNKLHNVMTNGTALGATLSSGQSTMIVPQPNSNLFYIFTVGYASGDAFRYSIVDISLSGGNGAVTQKGIILFSNSTEKIDAIYNPNDTSYWVMTHAWNTNQFYCYKITNQGLQPLPVISAIGSIHSGGTSNGNNAIGQMSFSEDGSFLANAIYDIGKIELFNFNLTTGVLSNVISLTGYTKPWGIAISNNNRFLYFTEWFDDDLYQLDLISGNAATIMSAKILVGTATFPTGSSAYKIGYLEPGFDGKIYIAKFGQHFISAINSPDLLGSACGFIDNAINLGTPTCNAGLSRTVTKYPPKYCSHQYFDSVYICSGDSAFINGIYYKYASDIIDTLVAASGCDSIITTSLLVKPIPVISLGNDTSFCIGDSIKLYVNAGFNSVLWNTSCTQDTITIYSQGTYWVQVTLNNCTNSDSILVLNNSSSFLSIADSTLCKDEIFKISLPSNYSYSWSDGSSSFENEFNTEGFYWVEITDNCKTYVDTFALSFEDCSCNWYIPNAFTPNGDGINEIFIPLSNCTVYRYELYIFNRWGANIFKSNDQNKGWNGKVKYADASDGVYFYQLIYYLNPEDKKSKILNGSLTLIR